MIALITAIEEESLSTSVGLLPQKEYDFDNNQELQCILSRRATFYSCQFIITCSICTTLTSNKIYKKTVRRQVRKASIHSINVKTSLTPSLSPESMKPLSLLHCSDISTSWDITQACGLISGYDEIGWVESHWWHCNGQHPAVPSASFCQWRMAVSFGDDWSSHQTW